jgi:hypothetical protein
MKKKTPVVVPEQAQLFLKSAGFKVLILHLESQHPSRQILPIDVTSEQRVHHQIRVEEYTKLLGHMSELHMNAKRTSLTPTYQPGEE